MAGEGLADVGNDPRRHDQHTMQKFRQVHLSRALAAGDRTATESVRPNASLEVAAGKYVSCGSGQS